VEQADRLPLPSVFSLSVKDSPAVFQMESPFCMTAVPCLICFSAWHPSVWHEPDGIIIFVEMTVTFP